MIINSLHVENLLSFDKFDLSLDGKNHVVVGPNGAGKSSIVRTVDLIQKGLASTSDGTLPPELVRAARQVLASFAGARHHGTASEREAQVRLALQFTTPAERKQMGVFIRAAVLCTLLEDVRTGDRDIPSILASWVDSELTDDKLAPLLEGSIVLRHAGMPHMPWKMSFQFTYSGVSYAWSLGPRTRSITPASAEDSDLASISPKRLAEHILGFVSSDLPTKLRDSLPDFDFSRLCPSEGGSLAAPHIQLGTGVFDEQLGPFRAAIEALDLPVTEISPGQRTITLSDLLSRLVADGVIIIGEQLRGIGAAGGTPQTPGLYQWEALLSPLRSYSPWQLPLRLFTLKNGTAEQRKRFTAIQSMFELLAPGRTFDLSFEATVDPSRNAMGDSSRSTDSSLSIQAAASISVLIERVGQLGSHPQGLPVQLHGAGTWEALVLAEALAEARDRFVVLDEPAVTLHPTWQKALRTPMKGSGGQFLVITHSADLVPIEDKSDLTRLVRLENETGHTTAHRIDESALSNEEARDIVQEFALSADATSMLFSRGVVLLEGETEPGVLPPWFTKSARNLRIPSPADLDLSFWSVGGDTRFHTYVKLLESLAIPWVLICDGAAFDVEKRQKTYAHIFEQVVSAGANAPKLASFLAQFGNNARPRTMTADLFAEQVTLGEQHGIFTLAPGWTTGKTGTPADQESFEAFLEKASPGARDQAKAAIGTYSKPRQGRWLGVNIECPVEVSNLYTKIVHSLSTRGLSVAVQPPSATAEDQAPVE